jgi:tRNA(Ile)-lysidine synthase
LEAAARLYRHAAWNTEARRVGASKILVAHTQDDLLETVLMRLLRGSGPAGFAAMPRSRGRIQRPLLDRSRSDVLTYLAARGIPYRTDSTNADPAFLRNRIRHTLIPCLDEFFPNWKRALLDVAETQRMAADFLSAEAAAGIPWTFGPWKERDGVWSTSSKNFFSQSPVLREEALFAVLDKVPGIKPPRRRNLRLFAGGALGALDLGHAILRRDAERVSLALQQEGETGFLLLIKGPGIYKLKGLTIRASPEDTTVGQRSIGFFAGLPLALRRNYPGDYIIRGGRKHRAAEDIRGKDLQASGLITAEDARGTAAFIGRLEDGFSIVVTREEENRESGLFFSIQ